MDYFGGKPGLLGYGRKLKRTSTGAALKNWAVDQMLHGTITTAWTMSISHRFGTVDWSVVMSALKDIKFEGSLNYGGQQTYA